MSNIIKIMTLNIGNPSKQRAQKQIEWIQNRKEDIFVLTETKNSDGCALIEDFFSGYTLNITQAPININSVSFPKSSTNDLGVMCLSRFPITKTQFAFEEKNQYYCRYLHNEIKINKLKLDTIGLYVPSRDQSEQKILRKKLFLEKTIQTLKSIPQKPAIICGDFNIVDINHIPKYNTFKQWEYMFYEQLIQMGYVDAFKKCHPDNLEYSWVGRTNSGYRYDYCFVSSNLEKHIKDCYFVHETREIKLTDHSALVLELSF